MCLFHLIQQNYRVRLPAHSLCQLTALLVTNVSGRCSDQTADAELLHIFTHINSNDVVLIVKQCLCQCLCQFGLTNTGRTEEQERAKRTVGILNTGTGAEDCLADFCHCFVLTDDTAMKHVLHMEQLLPLALHQFGNRNASPAADDSCDFLFRYFITQQRVLLFLLLFCNGFLFCQFLLQCRQSAVFQFRSTVQIVITFCTLDLCIDLFQFFPQLLYLGDCIFLVLPLGFHLVELIPHLREFLLYLLQMCFGQLVILFFQCGFLDLMLHDLPANLIQLCGHGIHLRSNHGTSFVHQVDCLIRQEPIRDIPVRQRCCCNQCLILNLYAVEYLVPFFQATQNRNCILYGRLIYHNRLEPTLQGSIFLNILPVLVQCRCTNAMQFATCQHRLQEVACIHCAIRFPGTHNGMQLIDEQNDTALALLHLVQNRFQTLFEFATVLCAGDQGAQIQREDLPVFQVGRDIATHNSQCQTLCNGSFTDTRLTDQNRIVLGLSGEDSNDISYLIISADDRIQFSGTGTLHQILSVFRQDIIGFFRILCGNTLVATHFHQCLQKCILGYGKRLKHLANRRIHGIEQAQH